jgi:nitroreductase
MINTILNHRSIRQFKEKDISDEVLDEILLAATKASTTGNMQVYSIVISKNQEIKEKLWESHFKQKMVMQAPVVATFCADFNRFNKWCKQRNANPGYDNFLSFYTASIDALLAAQNFCIAAEYKGLGICYLGTTTYMAEKIINILNLPTGVVPVTTVVAGYPDESPDVTDRLPLKGVVHYDTYKDYTPDDIDEIYEEKESMDLTKKLLQENQKETLAQVFTDNRYTKKNNITFSKSLIQVLKKQGFMNNEE